MTMTMTNPPGSIGPGKSNAGGITALGEADLGIYRQGQAQPTDTDGAEEVAKVAVGDEGVEQIVPSRRRRGSQPSRSKKHRLDEKSAEEDGFLGGVMGQMGKKRGRLEHHSWRGPWRSSREEIGNASGNLQPQSAKSKPSSPSDGLRCCFEHLLRVSPLASWFRVKWLQCLTQASP